ncbi:Uncharacterised protein [Vibrio cholerae]|nr:Uncharacterised protein [Vibrio cholerae]CSI48439.1 Uncharacterised protein [Vibrio cholerae]
MPRLLAQSAMRRDRRCFFLRDPSRVVLKAAPTR